jgi:LCP family protein required for cell wall assembly
MTSPRPRPIRRALAAALAAALLGACTDGSPTAEPTGSPTAPASFSPSPTVVVPIVPFAVDLREVRADGIDPGLRARDLREPARQIRSTVTELYRIGFVDPSAWAGGEFPGLLPLFAGRARAEAEDDVPRLTLGPAAAELDAVRPRRARLDVRFLADGRDRALVAVADVSFVGVGIDGEDRRLVRHDGEYTLRRSNGRWRIVAYDVRTRSAGRAETSFVPGFPARGPTFVLVIGSDARPGQSVAGARADSLHIVGVNPRLGRASVLGIPRDSWVPIPGAGTGKINAALARGGPDLMVQTVERLTGIPLDAYVLTGFAGFEALVGGVRGIDITIPSPVHDRYAHARFDAGREHLTGNEALAYARARHALPNGDFGRSLNQGRLIVAALDTLRDSIARRGPAAAFPWVVAGARELQTDLSLGDVVDLLLAAPAFDPERVRNEVATGRVGSVGGLSVVFLDGGAYARFRDLGRDGVLDG